MISFGGDFDKEIKGVAFAGEGELSDGEFIVVFGIFHLVSYLY